MKKKINLDRSNGVAGRIARRIVRGGAAALPFLSTPPGQRKMYDNTCTLETARTRTRYDAVSNSTCMHAIRCNEVNVLTDSKRVDYLCGLFGTKCSNYEELGKFVPPRKRKKYLHSGRVSCYFFKVFAIFILLNATGSMPWVDIFEHKLVR